MGGGPGRVGVVRVCNQRCDDRGFYRVGGGADSQTNSLVELSFAQGPETGVPDERTVPSLTDEEITQISGGVGADTHHRFGERIATSMRDEWGVGIADTLSI